MGAGPGESLLAGERLGGGNPQTWGLMRKEPKGDTVWEFPDGPEMRTRSSHC